jgi:membrane protein required for colicin V production
MHWFDIGVMIALIVGGVWSFFRGLVREMLSLVGLAAAFVLSIRGYPYVAQLLTSMITTAWVRQAVGFAVIFVAVMFASMLCIKLLRLFVRTVGLSFPDRLLGGLFGLVKVTLLVSVLLIVSAKFFPPFTKQLAAESALAPLFFRSAVLLAGVLEKHDYDAFHRLYRQMPWPFTVPPLLPVTPPAPPQKTSAPTPEKTPPRAPAAPPSPPLVQTFPQTPAPAPPLDDKETISESDARALEKLLNERLRQR